MKKVFLLLSALAYVLPALAVNVRVCYDGAPFSLAPIRKIDVLNDSSLGHEMKYLSKGIVVDVLSFSPDKNHVKVELKDGSRGYLPVIVLNAASKISVPEKQFVSAPYDRRKLSDLRFNRYLPAGTWIIDAIPEWTIDENGISPKLLVLKPFGGSDKFYAKIESGTASLYEFPGIDTPAIIKSLPVEKDPLESELILLPSGMRTLSKLKGKTRDEIERLIGSADTWLLESKGKGHGATMYYNTLAWVSDYLPGRLNVGAEVTYNEDGIAEECFTNAFYTVDKKESRYVKIGGLPRGSLSEVILDFMEGIQFAYLDLSGLFFRNFFLRLMEVLLLAFALVCMEYLRIRLSLKVGSNSFAGAMSFAVPIVAILLLSPAFSVYSSFTDLLYLFSALVVLYFGGRKNATLIRRNRCPHCHRYSPDSEYGRKEDSPVYVYEFIRKGVDRGKYKDKSYTPLSEVDYGETKVEGRIREDVWTREWCQDTRTFKHCPKCGNEWDFLKYSVLDTTEYVIRRYVSDRTEMKTIVAFAEGKDGEIMRMEKNRKGEYEDDSGDRFKWNGRSFVGRVFKDED